MVANNLLSNAFMCFSASKKNAIGHNNCCTSACFQLPKDERQKEQLGFGGVGYIAQASCNTWFIDGSFKGRVGQYQCVSVACFIVLAHCIHIHDVGFFYSV